MRVTKGQIKKLKFELVRPMSYITYAEVINNVFKADFIYDGLTWNDKLKTDRVKIARKAYWFLLLSKTNSVYK